MGPRRNKKKSTATPFLLALTRVVRMFAYGALSIILALYPARLEFDARAIGGLFTLTLFGDALVSLGLTTSADLLLFGAFRPFQRLKRNTDSAQSIPNSPSRDSPMDRQSQISDPPTQGSI